MGLEKPRFSKNLKKKKKKWRKSEKKNKRQQPSEDKGKRDKKVIDGSSIPDQEEQLEDPN